VAGTGRPGPLRQHGAESNPMGDDFNYAEEFKTSTWPR